MKTVTTIRIVKKQIPMLRPILRAIALPSIGLASFVTWAVVIIGTLGVHVVVVSVFIVDMGISEYEPVAGAAAIVDVLVSETELVDVIFKVLDTRVLFRSVEGAKIVSSEFEFGADAVDVRESCSEFCRGFVVARLARGEVLLRIVESPDFQSETLAEVEDRTGSVDPTEVPSSPGLTLGLSSTHAQRASLGPP